MFIMTAIVHIHCQPSYLETIKELGLNWCGDEHEVTAIVADKDISDDEEFVSSYGIDYDFVNCIELA